MIKDKNNIEHSVIKEFLVFSAVSDFSFYTTFEPRLVMEPVQFFPLQKYHWPVFLEKFYT